MGSINLNIDEEACILALKLEKSPQKKLLIILVMVRAPLDAWLSPCTISHLTLFQPGILL